MEAAAGMSGSEQHYNSHFENHLASLGNMVAQAMDPFGINVDVSIETPDGNRTKVRGWKISFQQANLLYKQVCPLEKLLLKPCNLTSKVNSHLRNENLKLT